MPLRRQVDDEGVEIAPGDTVIELRAGVPYIYTAGSGRAEAKSLELKDAAFEKLHPRDKNGRFAHVGATVKLSSGATATVGRVLEGGKLEVEHEDGKRTTVDAAKVEVQQEPKGRPVIKHYKHGEITADPAEAIKALEDGETYHHGDLKVRREGKRYYVTGGAATGEGSHHSADSAANDLNKRHEEGAASLRQVLDLVPKETRQQIQDAIDARNRRVEKSEGKREEKPEEPKDDLAEEQTKALQDYYGTGYRDMNAMLRNPDDWELDPGTRFSSRQEAEQATRRLKAVMRKSKTKRRATVYRGMVDLPEALQVGDVMEDDGFMSTSHDRDIAEGFGKYLFVIDVPEGSRGIDAETRESELVLDGGSVEITSVEGNVIKGRLKQP